MQKQIDASLELCFMSAYSGACKSENVASTSLKEFDYIGLVHGVANGNNNINDPSATSSSSSKQNGQCSCTELKPEDTDLRLGFGPSTDTSPTCMRKSVDSQIKFAISSFAMSAKRKSSETRMNTGLKSQTCDAQTENSDGYANGFPFMSFDNKKLEGTINSVQDETAAPPAKSQVVGWPPVQLYRRSLKENPAINQVIGWPPVPSHWRSKLNDKPPSDIFVKVKMDGIPIGRKIDLTMVSSYETLNLALEEMFSTAKNGSGFLKGADYVLTYEDKDGDCMLVGDVPWGMFVSTAKQLRIMRTSDTSSLGSSISNVNS